MRQVYEWTGISLVEVQSTLSKTEMPFGTGPQYPSAEESGLKRVDANVIPVI